MATYNPSLTHQNDDLSTPFPGDKKFVSCVDPPSSYPDNVNIYVNQASTAGSYSEILSVGSSISSHNYVEIPFTGGRNEKMFIPSKDDSVIFPSIDGQCNTVTGNLISNSVAGDSQMIPRTQSSIVDADGEQNFPCQGLSLSLGTQMTSAVSVPSFQYQHSNPSFSSFLRTHLPIPGKGTVPCQDDESEKNKELRTSESLLSGYETESLCNTPCSLGHKEIDSNAYGYGYEPMSFADTKLKSKYLKAAQQLLDEVVNVQKALKQPNSNKDQSCHGTLLDDFKGTDGRSSSQSVMPVKNGILSNPTESVTNSSSELSHAERQDLQNKKSKLLPMLEEVDRRYKQYYHQMQIVVSSFDMVAGRGAAKSYTALAHQTISRHFRSLRDAISGQIQVIQRSLGEQETSSSGQVGIPRLRFVDYQLRQQRALQHLGVMRHAWRPQRGLPENSVSILRAWLFEHFLHPYPNDSEKIMLARQTGLRRNQVANWFINARVRLWKPMVEDMYKEEFGDTEENSKSCPENAHTACSENSSAPEIRGEELQDCLLDEEMNKATASSVFQKDGHGDNVLNSGIMRPQDEQWSHINDHRFFASVPHSKNGNNVLRGATATYGISELSGFAIDNQVSLALGLRHRESDAFAGNNARAHNTVASSVGHDTVDYHCIDTGNDQDRFGNPHLLHDFVV